MYRRRIASLFAVPLLLAACAGSSPAPSAGGGESTGPGASDGGTASQPAASQPAASQPAASQGGGGGGKATVHLVITGGSVAGTYDADITEGGCSTGVTGPGTFAVASVTMHPDTAFDGPQITIYDAAAAASGTDTEFSAAFVFDNYATTVEVNPKIDRGSGTATLDHMGSSATLTIEGTGADGEGVSATIECHSVTNF